ncbi:MAG: M23 family metallopeptidase [Magnetovibrionaceae bacterium]
MIRMLVALFCFLTFACPAIAIGPVTQGDLIVAEVEPGSRVILDGREHRVTAGGQVLLAFGRDADPTSELEITAPDGSIFLQTIAVEPADWQIQRIDGLPSRKVTPKPEDIARIKDDNRQIGAVRRLNTADAFFANGFEWPAIGRISGVFGSQRILNGKPRRYHNGVDIAGPIGTPIVAAGDGVVALVHPDMFYSGKSVMIDHGHGLSSVYIHMSRTDVEVGQRVTRGQQIGAIGKTGRTTGPHLHWGMSLFNVHIDPARLVGPMPEAGG